MANNKKPSKKSATRFLSVRVDEEQKALVLKAAESEGLQISSFIIMLLVRLHILPQSCMQKLKRRPVPYFNELHGLLGVLNNIGGNISQLTRGIPDTYGVTAIQSSIQQAADAVTDALQGEPISASLDLGSHEAELRKIGTAFNLIVRSVNMGVPELSDLPYVLATIRDSADDLVAALSGKASDADVRLDMKKAADMQTSNNGV